jgi:hypothetical protein
MVSAAVEKAKFPVLGNPTQNGRIGQVECRECVQTSACADVYGCVSNFQVLSSVLLARQRQSIRRRSATFRSLHLRTSVGQWGYLRSFFLQLTAYSY